MRLDVYLSTRFNEIQSRERAKKLIKNEKIRVNGKIALKPSLDVTEQDSIEILEQMPFVSRGGEKLQAALSQFKINVNNRIAIDIGASTGGFTDCLLQNGVSKVYCIDVGSAQLHPSLHNNPKIINYEHINARYLSQYIQENIIELSPNPDLLVMDVSFISVTKIILDASKIMAEKSDFIVLIKPQFEMDEKIQTKKGVIKSAELHQQAIAKVKEFVSQNGFSIKGLIPSPIKGGDGNKEFLIWFKN
jgi:23S rRNA (cytidine1920-2'-O)/16S rRNA (cytidine1409-2'-O)-methyltransferase